MKDALLGVDLQNVSNNLGLSPFGNPYIVGIFNWNFDSTTANIFKDSRSYCSKGAKGKK